MRVVKGVGVLLLLLAVVFLVVYIMGSRLPNAHTVSVSVVIDAPQQHVWDMIENVGAQPAWRAGLKSVQMLPPQKGQTCWLETNSMGKMPLCEVLAAPTTLRVVRIADPDLSYGGIWTYQLEPAGAEQTRLTITENGTTGPAIWRFVGHYFFHEDTQIKKYESSLQAAVAKH